MIKKIAFVAHEFGRYKNHGGISMYLMNLVRFINEHTDIECHVICVECDPNFNHPKTKLHKLRNFDQTARKKVTKYLLEINPEWVEVADFGGLCSDFLVRRAMGEFATEFPIICNHHTGAREIWEWGCGTRFSSCSSGFLSECNAHEDVQARLSDSNVSVSTFLTNYLRVRLGVKFLPPLFPYYPIDSKNNSQCDVDSDVSERCLRVLSLGRFEPRKRQDILIDAAVNLLDVGVSIQVTFVGNSVWDEQLGVDYRDFCYSKIPKKWREYFSFIEFTPAHELVKLYQNSDLFCIPSPMENFPTTALESISIGLPVLASIKSGVMDMVAEDGLYFDPNQSNALTCSLHELANRSKQELVECGQRQKARLQELLKPENTVIHRIEVFNEIAAAPVVTQREVAVAVVYEEFCEKQEALIKVLSADGVAIRYIYAGCVPRINEDVCVYLPHRPHLNLLRDAIKKSLKVEALIKSNPITFIRSIQGRISKEHLYRDGVGSVIICGLPNDEQGGRVKTLRAVVANELLQLGEFVYFEHPKAKHRRLPKNLVHELDRRLNIFNPSI
jgi:glycosyltransferase involved in cell wall biosynthesis